MNFVGNPIDFAKFNVALASVNVDEKIRISGSLAIVVVNRTDVDHPKLSVRLDFNEFGLYVYFLCESL